MGDHVRRPLDDCVSRIVDSWQLSQPLHLRHLSIVRDTALKGKTQIYIYYTYENFKKLVEGGKRFWEAVETVPSGVKMGKNVAAALDAKPDVDEYGFPRLDEKQFQGRQNDATFEECVSALQAEPLHISSNDPVLRKLADGSSGKQCDHRSRFVFIDSIQGIRPRSHKQDSTATGNGSNPTRAVITPSRAAPPKARVVERRPVKLPKPPHEIGLMATTRKQIRKSDSKSPGRPRKYPKTGLPANFNTMKPKDVDLLFRSQEMFEHHEIVKVEREIDRRIGNGEDAVAVAYEVLAERDASRKQEGELPLPKKSRIHVLHKYVGESVPDLDPDEARSEGQNPNCTRYRPSMAAHTYLVPMMEKRDLADSETKDPGTDPAIVSARTRRRARSVSDLESIIYLPSVAAHSWPCVHPPSSAVDISTTEALQDSFKCKQGQFLDSQLKHLPSVAAHSGSSLQPNTSSTARARRKRKRTPDMPPDNGEEHIAPFCYKYLPSMAAHSGMFLPTDALHEVETGRKRQRTAYSLSQHDKHQTAPSISSITRQTSLALPTQGASLGASSPQLNACSESLYPGWEMFMAKHYQQQLGMITRRDAGVFFGKMTPRRKRPCEPRDFRPTHFKLAIFKSSRLSDLDWFSKTPTISERTSRMGSRTQTPATQLAEPAPTLHDQSISKGQSDPLSSTSLPSPTSPLSASQGLLPYISPYTSSNGTKRKRTVSLQPTRGVVSFDPFSASPHSRRSSPTPTTEPSNTVSNSSTLQQVVASSSANDLNQGLPITRNDAHARTPERQPDTSESSEVTQSALVLTELGAQSKVVTTHIVQSSQSCTQEADKPSNAQSIGKINRRGGSTALLRKIIIMDIVEKCEGVFPSHKEMSLPFAAEWKKRGQEGTPEPKTISNAVNALITEKRLRQITFTSQTKQGLAVTKTMLILPSIDTSDPRVKQTQENMVAYHPRHFVPMAVLPPQDYQSIAIREDNLDGEKASAKTTEEMLQDAPALEPAELRRLTIVKKMMDGKDRAAMARLKALKEKDQQGTGSTDADESTTQPSIHRISIDGLRAGSGTLNSKRSGGGRGPKRVERLASIKKSIPPRISPLPRIPASSVSNSGSLTWLPSNYAFSDFNFEEERPAVLTAAVENDVQACTPGALISFDSREQARQRVREFAKTAARIERKQALAKPTRPSLPYTDAKFGQSKLRGITASSSPNLPLSDVSGRPVAAHTDGVGNSNQRLKLVSFMDPVHYFHRATGTFSVAFSGFRPPRKILSHRGTTLDPYAANLKAVQHINAQRKITRTPTLRGLQNPGKTKFEEEVDELLKQELEATEFTNIVLVGWPFVNHLFSHAHKTVAVAEADMETAKQVTVGLKNGRLVSKRFPQTDSRAKIRNSIFSTGGRTVDVGAAETRTQLKRRRLTSVVGTGTQDKASEQVKLDQDHRPAKLRRVRGPRDAKSLGDDGEERLLTAVMVIRTLTGGLDKHIDWVLVAKVFEPAYTQMFIHSRWSHTLQKHKLILPQMESNFENIFLSGYEDGTIPTIDYDNLEDYDWRWLVEWTMANINRSTQSLPEIPADRIEFDDLYTLTERSSNDINDFYEIDGSSVLTKRTKTVHRDPYVLPLTRGRRGVRPEDAEDLATAKSWIRANIMTPESTYNPSVARVKLSTFPDRMIEDALKQLLHDRVLTQENKGRLVPGRNYDISDFLVSRLKKNLQSTHFHRAAAYKQQLDHDFEEKGYSNYSYTAEDGDMIAIVNLQAHKRIRVVPINVPMNEWGQTDGGYETRRMDKRRLNFSLELRPSPTYIYGNPLQPLPAPPSQHLQESMAKIPLWYDIQGSLVPVMWEMVLAAVVAVLAMRTGIGASELETVMRPAMEAWELQLVLEWLVHAKAAKPIGHGFSVEDEWWWLALGTVENTEGS